MKRKPVDELFQGIPKAARELWQAHRKAKRANERAKFKAAQQSKPR